MLIDVLAAVVVLLWCRVLDLALQFKIFHYIYDCQARPIANFAPKLVKYAQAHTLSGPVIVCPLLFMEINKSTPNKGQ